MDHKPAPLQRQRNATVLVWERATERLQALRAASDERGATAAEYALMAGFIALAIIISISFFSTRVGVMFTTYGNTLPG
jgi:Flp pilus assembly pilin Flp